MLKAITMTGAMIVLGAAAALAQTSGATTGGAKQMTSAECQSVWSKAAGSGATGSLTETQAQAYVQDFKRADTNQDGTLSNAEFTTACQQGMVRDSATTGAGSGGSGSNSTTGGSSKK